MKFSGRLVITGVFGSRQQEKVNRSPFIANRSGQDEEDGRITPTTGHIERQSHAVFRKWASVKINP